MKIVFIFFALSVFATEQFELERKDGSKIIGYYDKPDTKAFSITILLPGSQKESSLRLHEALKKDFLIANRCPVTLEKRGVDSDKIDDKQYVKFLTHDHRVSDHLVLVEALGNDLIIGWDGTLSILGQGDGGRIGATLASKLNHLTALMLVCSGGGWKVGEEALYSFRKEMADQGYPPQYIHGFLVQAKREFAEALKSPIPERMAFGYSYAYWESQLKSNFLEDLTLVDCPIYSIHGTLDDRVPIESVSRLVKELEDKITFKQLEGRGREIMQDPKVYKEAISWLEGASGS